MHVSSLVMQDQDLHRKAELLHYLSEGVVSWHSDQASGCKSPAENRAFYRRQARGAVWECFTLPLSLTTDTAALHLSHFLLAPPPGVSLTLGHPW
eukprot:5519995-Lingulodinium_polyedra.AAC.1